MQFQTWCADDLACVAELTKLRGWFDRLRNQGADFGYYPEPSMSFVVVDPNDMQFAQDTFGDSGVQFVTGHHFLQGYVGVCTVQGGEFGSLY